MGLPYYRREKNVAQSRSTYYKDIRGPILLTQGDLDLGTPAIDAHRTVKMLRDLGGMSSSSCILVRPMISPSPRMFWALPHELLIF